MTPPERHTVLQAAGLTDTGKVRSNNQDQFMLSPDTRLWVVADGMGGHKGGEVASDLACQEMARSYAQQTVTGLREAVVAANQAVHDAGEAEPNLRGMGTTMVALAVVRVTSEDLDDVRTDLPETQPDEEILAIANVGDSRAYRMVDGELYQVTDDHSLVAEMVRDGNLAPEEAETHPQKNILTRVLGPYDEVTVDVIAVQPRVGDRYLLCSDGLFNEVSANEIGAVLRRLADPADAADELVRMALAAGARDNTTVVIADVVDDPTTAAAAADERLAGAYSDPHESTRQAHVHLDTAEIPAGVATNGHSANGKKDPDIVPRRSRRDRRDGRDKGPKPRRFTWRVALFLVVLLALVGGAVYTVQWYATNAYYVGFEGDEVAIFQGRPGGVLWLDPELQTRTPLSRDGDIPPQNVASIDAGQEYDTLDEAEAFVDELTEQATEYVVGLDDDDVVIFEEAPGADPEVVDRPESGLVAADLPEERQDELAQGRAFAHNELEDAESFLARLEDEADDTGSDDSTDTGTDGDGGGADGTDPADSGSDADSGTVESDGGGSENAAGAGAAADTGDAGDEAALTGDDGGRSPVT